MKFGGVSWNESQHNKQKNKETHICSECGRRYRMSWARDRHQRICNEHSKSLEEKK